MQLAARAALLYLNHAVLAKARGRLALPVTVRFGDASPELQVRTLDEVLLGLGLGLGSVVSGKGQG